MVLTCLIRQPNHSKGLIDGDTDNQDRDQACSDEGATLEIPAS